MVLLVCWTHLPKQIIGSLKAGTLSYSPVQPPHFPQSLTHTHTPRLQHSAWGWVLKKHYQVIKLPAYFYQDYYIHKKKDFFSLSLNLQVVLLHCPGEYLCFTQDTQKANMECFIVSQMSCYLCSTSTLGVVLHLNIYLSVK